MPEPVTVIIATLDDERWIGASVDSAFAAGAAEVIVSDGGSRDATWKVAQEHGANVIESQPWRSRQFNFAANAAKHDALIFLHADTTLPAGACAAVARALKRFDFGGFRISFAGKAWQLRIAAMMINLRTRITRCPWGDQAQFVRRSKFTGFREIPLMEDYELATRMRRRTLLPMDVTTSGRRFLEKGLFRTAIINWSIIVRWRLGRADAESLAKIYRR